jgi:hypothetical protein
MEKVESSHGQPGPFTLFHNADNPDLDGNFILNWTPSTGAWFYEAYRSSSMITELNGSQTLLATNLTLGGYDVLGTPEGSFYFVVAARNGTGYTLSNNILINVGTQDTSPQQISFGNYFIPLFIIGVSIVMINLIRTKKIKNQSEREK